MVMFTTILAVHFSKRKIESKLDTTPRRNTIWFCDKQSCLTVHKVQVYLNAHIPTHWVQKAWFSFYIWSPWRGKKPDEGPRNSISTVGVGPGQMSLSLYLHIYSVNKTAGIILFLVFTSQTDKPTNKQTLQHHLSLMEQIKQHTTGHVNHKYCHTIG